MGLCIGPRRYHHNVFDYFVIWIYDYIYIWFFNIITIIEARCVDYRQHKWLHARLLIMKWNWISIFYNLIIVGFILCLIFYMKYYTLSFIEVEFNQIILISFIVNH